MVDLLQIHITKNMKYIYIHTIYTIFLISSLFTTLHADLRNQVTAVGAPATVPTGDNIGVAAKALSDASYPFLKEAQVRKL